MTTKRPVPIRSVSPAQRGSGAHEDDRAFESWAEAIDFADAPGPDVEAALASVDPDAVPLDKQFVEAAVARASMIERRPVRRFRSLAAAAVLLAGMMLTAATVVVLLWPERRNTLETLDYAEAIALTQQSSRTADHGAAFMVLSMRIIFGVQALKELASNPEEVDELRALAVGALESLRVLLEAGDNQVPSQVAPNLAQLVHDVGNRQLSTDGRTQSLARLLVELRQGVLAVKFPKGASQESAAFQGVALRGIREELVPR
jgi:hypothetical protein